MVQGRNYKLHKSEDTKNLLNFESKKIDGFDFLQSTLAIYGYGSK